MSNDEHLDSLNKLSKILGRMYSRPIRIIDNIERWIAYRTYDRYNVIKIPTLTPHYYDKDHIFLHGCFALLTDYVEIELGGRSKSNRNYEKEIELEERLREKGYKILAKILDKWHDTRFLPRCVSNLFDKTTYTREAGLEYLEERVNQPLDSEYPEENKAIENWKEIYKEVRDLYLWWHDVYLKRKDEHDEVGLTEFNDKIRAKYGETHVFNPTSPAKKAFTMDFVGNKEEEAELHSLYEKCWALEEARRKEDEEMLIRLVKIRLSLWT